MNKRADDREQKLDRGNAQKEIHKLAETALVDVELEHINVYKLFKTFQRILERYKNVQDKYIHQIVKSNYTVKEQQAYIFNMLSKKEQVSFEELFENVENRMHAVVTFLAMLELINEQSITIVPGLDVNNFWISQKEKTDSEEE